ncbi:NADPH:quinone oxidoreductase family protein [Patulibacter brassicae]|jgi:NADPH2:quinone reductase|uniref:NADPH:quinone oxidoreductase family protein n=1 Tax=Patulibacter brassicae TaxID=1705717 RepID=A0ABU4VMW4_9ACTN|nr:NADPH:quinone oxidoreductase family protein [Patulibacter brassicae]MDX8152702.1 NADPH:quinone oxidoreductase family protein [Patulibacter brassicae]
MRAVRLVALDGPDGYVPADVPEPERGADELLIDVRAAGVAFPDLLLSRGEYQYAHELPVVLGAEVAGVVLEAPEGGRFAPGDRVAAITFTGGFAERATAPADRALPLPASLSFAEGAALPSNYLTALFALELRGRLRAGEALLVHGATGGLGSAAIQVGRALGARTIAVVGGAAKVAAAREIGADEVVVADEGWRDAVLGLAPGGVDVVFDVVGGERFLDSLRSLRPQGRLIVAGFAGGEIPTVRVNRLLLRNIDVVGAALGSYMHSDPDGMAPLCDRLGALLEHPAMRPAIGGRLPLEDVAEAVRRIADRRATGKLVVEP